MKIVAFDFETGGFSPDRNAITQLAMLACEVKGGKIDAEAALLKVAVKPHPQLIVEDSALEVQGHTRLSLAQRPHQVSEKELVDMIHDFLTNRLPDWLPDSAPLVAHSAKFDVGFMEALLRRHGKIFPPRHVLCTLERHKILVSRKLTGKSENNKLGTLAKLVGLSQQSAHDAAQDARICAALFAWQENLLTGQAGLLDDGPVDPVGIVYQSIPVPADAWWTRHSEEFPIKAPDHAHPLGKVCGGCGACPQWRRPYRLGTRRGPGNLPVQQFFACDSCKASEVSITNAIGLSGDEAVIWEGDWFKLILSPPNPSAPEDLPPPADLPKSSVAFTCPAPLVRLLAEAKENALPQVHGFTTRSGRVDDVNRYVQGAFTIIRSTLDDLSKLAAIVENQREQEKKEQSI